MSFKLRAWLNTRTGKLIDIGNSSHAKVLFDKHKDFGISDSIHKKAKDVSGATDEWNYKGVDVTEYMYAVKEFSHNVHNWARIWIENSQMQHELTSRKAKKKVYSALMKIVPLPILDKVFPGLWEQTYAQYLIGDILVEELL